jgi:hypothetical protein
VTALETGAADEVGSSTNLRKYWVSQGFSLIIKQKFSCGRDATLFNKILKTLLHSQAQLILDSRDICRSGATGPVRYLVIAETITFIVARGSDIGL